MFFQKGETSDTLKKDVNDAFYLIVPDSLKHSVYLSIENGQLRPAGSDSLVKLVHLPGLRYDYIYVFEKPYADQDRSKYKALKQNQKGSYQSLIAGTSTTPPEQVTVKLLDSRLNKLLYERTWLYRKQP